MGNPPPVGQMRSTWTLNMARIKIRVTQVGTQHYVKTKLLTNRHVDRKSKEVSLAPWHSFFFLILLKKIKVEFENKINYFLRPARNIPDFMQLVIVNRFPIPDLNCVTYEILFKQPKHTSQKSILSFGTVILQKHLSFMESSALAQPLGCNKRTYSARLFLPLPFTELHPSSNQT